MNTMLVALCRDDAGFVVSSALILIATIVVLGLVVGLSEASIAVNEELEDVGSAIGAMNQTFGYAGVSGHKGYKAGSAFCDEYDYCDSQFDINCNSAPLPEAHKAID